MLTNYLFNLIRRCCLIILLSGCSNIVSNAQNIGDLFLSLPDSCFNSLENFSQHPLSAATRKSILQQTANTGYQLLTNDSKHAYLNIVTTGDGDNMSLELCYWNFSRSKLLAVSINTDGNCTSFTNAVFIYTVLNGKLTDKTQELKPSISLNNFQFDQLTDTAIVKNLTAQNIHCRWSLPKQGKAILVKAPSYDCGDDSLPNSNCFFEITPVAVKNLIIKKIATHDKAGH